MRIGLVGYGKGGRYFHAPLIASLREATFVGVVTRSAERRAELAQDHPG
ncbi:gfo/Idh/MocA family oxidoreductase, partial [Pseudomonas quasicaspiana]|nr:gfo/Idh/MocA family oxidoreductase [Pseudomonas quasicaspiana]